jgi:hypothetical protein
MQSERAGSVETDFLLTAFSDAAPMKRRSTPKAVTLTRSPKTGAHPGPPISSTNGPETHVLRRRQSLSVILTPLRREHAKCRYVLRAFMATTEYRRGHVARRDGVGVRINSLRPQPEPAISSRVLGGGLGICLS